MNERDLEDFLQLLKNPEFKELDTQLYVLHSRLRLANIKAVYVPDDGRSIPGVGGQPFIIKPPGWEEAKFNRFISEFFREADRIAWQMARFFPNPRRLVWKERFVAFAVLGDYAEIPTRDVFFITRCLSKKEEKNFIFLAERYKNDKTAKAILNSFNEATNDPDNELIHLFDIWEALKSEFKSEEKTLTELRISVNQKKQFTRLANNEPVRQGRHRGRHAGKLRNATNEELETVRKIAANMIYAYLKYLDVA